MSETLPVKVIRTRYRKLMVDIYDCLARNDTQRALAIRARIIRLFIALTSMKGSREILNMKACLNLMGNKLLNPPFSHASN